MKKHLVSIATLVVIAGLALGAVAIWQARRAGTPSAAPATAAAKQPEGPEGIVHFSDAQIRQFGVGTDVAGQGRLRIEVVLPGEVALNADRVAHVVPRVSGVVREVRKNLGDTVLRGEIMAVLESRELADSTAALLAARERVNLAQSNFAREEQLWQKKISPEQDYIQAKNALAEAGIELRTTEQKLRALGFSEQYIAKLPDRGGKRQFCMRWRPLSMPRSSRNTSAWARFSRRNRPPS